MLKHQLQRKGGRLPSKPMFFSPYVKIMIVMKVSETNTCEPFVLVTRCNMIWDTALLCLNEIIVFLFQVSDIYTVFFKSVGGILEGSGNESAFCQYYSTCGKDFECLKTGNSSPATSVATSPRQSLALSKLLQAA